jgi:DNA repair photolyase
VLESPSQTRARPVKIIRVKGGLREHLRFFHTVHTAISRKRDIQGQAVKSGANLQVVSIEALAENVPLFDITTETGDFIANGVVSHNCYARPTHEYLGFSAGLDFETRIMVKEDAPLLLRKELSAKNWQPQVVALGTVTDVYQPIERKLQLTRRCLEVFVEFRNPISVVTKNHLVSRDRDLYGELARHQAAMVFVSLTTLDASLARRMEPRASQPLGRLAAIEELTSAGVPVGVMVAPIIPGLNDHEIPAILGAAARAGARFAYYVLLRLPHGVSELFQRWLEEHYPGSKERVLGRLRDMRGGKLNDANFGSRMVGEGVLAEQIKALFRLGSRQAGLEQKCPQLSTAAFRRPGGTQRSLFDELC